MKTRLLLLVLALSLASCVPAVGQLLPPYWTVQRVTRVLDGDTYEVLVNSQKKRLRLLNVDCPEKGQPYGDAVTAQLKPVLFPGRNVQLHLDGTDLYGRSLGHIRLIPSVGPPQRLDSLLVARGWAWASGGPSAVPGGPWLSLHNSVSGPNSIIGLWKFNRPGPPPYQYAIAVPPPIWRHMSRQTKNLYRTLPAPEGPQ